MTYFDYLVTLPVSPAAARIMAGREILASAFLRLPAWLRTAARLVYNANPKEYNRRPPGAVDADATPVIYEGIFRRS